MNQLSPHDLQFAIRRLPFPLVKIMRDPAAPRVLIGGGYLRAIVSGEFINDIDCFCASKADAKTLSELLSTAGRSGGKPTRRVLETDNAFTVFDYKPVIQIIHRWNFTDLNDLINSFDFTCCAAAFTFATQSQTWYSKCLPDFYPAVAAKRLEYTSPRREEAPGGSMLRVLKYYQKGYRIPLDSLAKVITRLLGGLRTDNKGVESFIRGDDGDTQYVARILCGLLREVDPSVDPTHAAHLPSAADFAEEEGENTDV